MVRNILGHKFMLINIQYLNNSVHSVLFFNVLLNWKDAFKSWKFRSIPFRLIVSNYNSCYIIHYIRSEPFESGYLMTMLQAIDTFYLSWKICETCKCKYMLMTWALPFVEDPPKEFLMVEFFELANQEQSLNTFMNTNNYNSKFW